MISCIICLFMPCLTGSIFSSISSPFPMPLAPACITCVVSPGQSHVFFHTPGGLAIDSVRSLSTPSVIRVDNPERLQHRFECGRGGRRADRVGAWIALCRRPGGSGQPLGRERQKYCGVHEILLRTAAKKP